MVRYYAAQALAVAAPASRSNRCELRTALQGLSASTWLAAGCHEILKETDAMFHVRECHHDVFLHAYSNHRAKSCTRSKDFEYIDKIATDSSSQVY